MSRCIRISGVYGCSGGVTKKSIFVGVGEEEEEEEEGDEEEEEEAPTPGHVIGTSIFLVHFG